MDIQPGSTIIVDASVAIKWFDTYNENDVEQAKFLLMLLIDQKIKIYAPELLKYELSNILIKAKKLNLAEYQQVIDFLYSLPIVFIPETSSQAQIAAEAAQTFELSYYDASYLALAIALNGILISSDKKLISSTENQGITIGLNKINIHR